MKKFLIILAGAIVSAVLTGALYIWQVYGSLNIPWKSDTTAISEGAFSLPKEFSSFTVFSDGVPDARTMVIAPRGVLLVAQPDLGIISALPDENGDGKADRVVTVVEGLDLPHGLAFRCRNIHTPDVCELYIAEHNALSVFTYDGATMSATGKKKLLDFPSGGIGTHKTRTLLFLPSPQEDELLISVGSSCNVCEEEDDRRATILRYHTVSGKTEHYATGLRNSVFMALHPVTGKVWATEMGRDGLGDDIPPDEINIIEESGFYGWPWFYGKNIEDRTFSPNARPSFSKGVLASVVDIPAHSAPLGISFIPEEGWPEAYWFSALVAYHGSWNRSIPTGYKVVRVIFDTEGKYKGTEDFITGWLDKEGKTIGRPADVLVLSGGVLYVSDDQAGRIYKLSRENPTH